MSQQHLLYISAAVVAAKPVETALILAGRHQTER